MSATLDISISGVQELANKLESATKEKVIKDSLTSGALLVTGWVKKNRLTGPRPGFLGVLTGRLRSSIAAGPVDRTGNQYTVAIGTNVKYAKIHEFGGIIRPRNKPFLAWKGPGGKYIFTQKPVVMPARPFFRPAIEDQGNRAEVLNILVTRINRALEGESIGRQAVS